MTRRAFADTEPESGYSYIACVWATIGSESQNVIEFSGAGNICLDKLSRKLHTTWYVTGYN